MESPPSGLTVLVTRPQPQADEWAAALGHQGVQATALPLLQIEAAADADAVRRAWRDLANQALVMFVSPNAARCFMALRPAHCAWPADVLAAGTGPGTHRCLLAAGVPAPLICTPGQLDPAYRGPFDSEALWQALCHQDWRDRQALIVRGEGGRDWLADSLRQRGARVHFLEAYRRHAVVLDGEGQSRMQQALAQPSSHLWLLSSSEAVQHLPALAPGQPWGAHQALATHGRIAATARALGFGRVAVCEPLLEAVTSAVQGWQPCELAARPAEVAPIQSVQP